MNKARVLDSNAAPRVLESGVARADQAVGHAPLAALLLLGGGQQGEVGGEPVGGPEEGAGGGHDDQQPAPLLPEPGPVGGQHGEQAAGEGDLEEAPAGHEGPGEAPLGRAHPPPLPAPGGGARAVGAQQVQHARHQVGHGEQGQQEGGGGARTDPLQRLQLDQVDQLVDEDLLEEDDLEGGEGGQEEPGAGGGGHHAILGQAELELLTSCCWAESRTSSHVTLLPSCQMVSSEGELKMHASLESWLARAGTGWHGLAQAGTAWHGLARAGTGWHGLARAGTLRQRQLRKCLERVLAQLPGLCNWLYGEDDITHHV